MKLKRILFRGPWKALLAALLIGLVCGVGEVGEPLENAMQVARDKLRKHQSSGDIVLVAIDDRSLREMRVAPFGDAEFARLVRKIDSAGARRLHVDVEFDATSSQANTRRLEAAIATARAEILLPARFLINPVTGARNEQLPPPNLTRHARTVNTNLLVRWDDAVRYHPYAAQVGDKLLPSLASVLGTTGTVTRDLFPIDYGIDVRSVPVISASDLLADRVRLETLSNKDVVIARTDANAKHYRAPGYTWVPVIMFQVMAAETLLAGRPIGIGWLIPLLVGGSMAAVILYARTRYPAIIMIAAAGTGSLVGPLLLEHNQIRVEVVPFLVVVLIATLVRSVASLRRSYHIRGTTNLVTGIPNLQALRQTRDAVGGIIVAARVKNYAQITTTLPPQHEKELVEQIVGRLQFGSGGSVIYQADEGVFVWVVENSAEEGVVQQLEGLQALFRSPIVIASRLIDLTITFGLDLDGSRTLIQRVSSALVAADDAARTGKRWASFNPASVEDADWAMSLLARLDHAIDNGELWVAYQPKLDCRTGSLVGAEALVRWTHPEKGQVYPDQFIGAAEQGGRIERLTYLVLDKALAAAALINREGRRFSVAVNLSALLLDNSELVPTVKSLLAHHGVAPKLLTLEVTETSTLGSAAEQISNLERLSEMGIRLSIDDYGTGFSTLEYLKRIPASEIKIDRSFVGMLNKSQSDRIMVNSTIQLAHSLGRKVVAEGVENEEILQELKRMRCDIVQGYHTGRPMPLDELLARLGMEASDRAA